MEMRQLEPRALAGRPRPAAAQGPGAPAQGGWLRCQVMGRPAQLWIQRRDDTRTPSEATSPAEDSTMLKRATRRASSILSGSLELYREMALSAFSLVKR